MDFYDRHAAGVYAFVLSLVRIPTEAEDIVQDVFIKVYERQNRWFGLRNPVGYLYRAARNAAISQLRKQAVRGNVPIESPILVEAEDGVNAEQLARMNAAINALPPEQREVVLLKTYEELTFRQIANITGCSLATAASRYRYGLEKLRILMQEDEHGSH